MTEPDRVTESDLLAALRAWGRQRDFVAQCQAEWQPAFDAQATLIHELQGGALNSVGALAALDTLRCGDVQRFAEAIVELGRLVGVYRDLKRHFDAGG